MAAASLPFMRQYRIFRKRRLFNLVGKLDIAGFKKQTNGGTRFQVATQDAQTAFSIGGDAFLANDKLVAAEFEVSETGVVAGLAITAGQLLSVLPLFRSVRRHLKHQMRLRQYAAQVVFVDVETDKPHTYLCCCYGEVAVQNSTTGEAQILKNSYHTARFITPEVILQRCHNAPLNHYDDQLVALEGAVGREPHWQLPDGKLIFFAPTPLSL